MRKVGKQGEGERRGREKAHEEERDRTMWREQDRRRRGKKEERKRRYFRRGQEDGEEEKRKGNVKIYTRKCNIAREANGQNCEVANREREQHVLTGTKIDMKGIKLRCS